MLVAKTSLAARSIGPEGLEAGGRQVGVAHRLLDVAMPGGGSRYCAIRSMTPANCLPAGQLQSSAGDQPDDGHKYEGPQQCRSGALTHRFGGKLQCRLAACHDLVVTSRPECPEQSRRLYDLQLRPRGEP